MRTGERRGELVVTVWGEVDLASAASLRDALLGAVARAGSAVVIELGGVEYLDSTGVHALYDAIAAADAAHKHLRAEGARPNVMRVLRITGVTDAMTVTETP